MAKAYGEDAIETCRRLYCKYGGKNHDAIQREMRAAGYAGWSKINLHNRGKEGTRSERLGWITKYGFDNSLRLHLEKLVEKVNDDEQDLYLSIKSMRKRLEANALRSGSDGKDMQLFRDFARLEMDARDKMDLSRANLETFAESYHLICTWAPDIDPELARRLVKGGDRFAELAQAHYGKAQTDDDGGGPGEDEGVDGPAPGESKLRLVG